MADNVEITAGTGTVVHADEYTDATYGAGKSQQVKIADGTPGSGNKLIIDANGGANVSGAAADDAAASGNPVLMGGKYIATPTALSTDGDAGYVLLNQYRAVCVQQINSSGNLIDPSTVNEDAESTGGSSGIPALAVRRDSKTVRVGTDGDWANLSMNSVGDLRVDGGQSFSVQTTVPTTAIAYTALDAVGGILTFANMARATGAGGTLMGATLHCQSTVAANDFQIFVYSASPASGTYTDNGVWTGHDTDTDLLVDSFSLDTHIDMNTGSVLKARNLNIPYLCAATSLFVTIRSTAYTGTPAANAFKLTLHTIRD